MVSVIIPLYNKAKIVERSIRSVLSQSYKDFELIVIDDGSTDESYNIVKAFNDPRIFLFRQPNGGPGKARNTGVAYAKGEWTLFLDADDELNEKALEYLTGIADSFAEVNIVDGSYIVRSSEGERSFIHNERWIPQNNYKAFFYRQILPSTGHTLFKTELLRRYPYNTNIRRYEDVELLMRLLKDARIVTTSKIIFFVNADYSAASTARDSITEDFLGYLSLKGKSFWEKMCLYQFYLWEREHYSDEVNELYPMLRYRYDLFFVNKFLNFIPKVACYLKNQ